MKQSFASGLPREKTVFVRVACSLHLLHVATSDAMTGSGLGAFAAWGVVGADGLACDHVDGDAGGGATFSVIGIAADGPTGMAAVLAGGLGAPSVGDEALAAEDDVVELLGGVPADGSSFTGSAGAATGVAGVAGAAGAAARASRGRRGIPELPQSTCHSR